MELELIQRKVREEFADRVRYIVQRRQEVAFFLTGGPNVVHGTKGRGPDAGVGVEHTFKHHVPQGEPTSDDVAADLLCEVTDYLCTHLGRNAHGTTRLQKGRIHDYKHRASRRRDATQHTFAHNVDLQRAWTHFRSHFVPGGKVWAKMGRVQKRDMRSAIHEADIHLRTYGDYVGAWAIITG